MPPLIQHAATCTNLEKLKQELREELLREIYGAKAMKAPTTHHTSIFSESVMVAPFTDNFKILSITLYDEKGDPTANVEVFSFWMNFECLRDNLILA